MHVTVRLFMTTCAQNKDYRCHTISDRGNGGKYDGKRGRLINNALPAAATGNDEEL